MRMIAAALTAALVNSVPAAVAGDGGAALLYAYEIDRGEGEAFEAGYKAHLDWHRGRNDRLVWYGWYVVAGARVGAFVDGTFGADFADVDARPALKEDGAHFTEHVAPYASPTRYAVYELWGGPSTAPTLEDRDPSRYLDAYFLEVAPAEAAAFEKRLASLPKSNAPLAWYRAGPGAPAPGYMLLAPRRDWASFAGRGVSFGDLIRAAYNADEADVAALARSIGKIDSEIWAYRPDLSYIPTSP